MSAHQAERAQPLLCRLRLHKFWEYGDNGTEECRIYTGVCARCGVRYSPD